MVYKLYQYYRNEHNKKIMWVMFARQFCLERPRSSRCLKASRWMLRYWDTLLSYLEDHPGMFTYIYHKKQQQNVSKRR